MSEVDRYWQRQAEAAYAERLEAVRIGLRDMSGELKPWMRNTISGADLRREWEAYWFGPPLTTGAMAPQK